jgi:hypothetical protein
MASGEMRSWAEWRTRQYVDGLSVDREQDAVDVRSAAVKKFAQIHAEVSRFFRGRVMVRVGFQVLHNP